MFNKNIDFSEKIKSVFSRNPKEVDCLSQKFVDFLNAKVNDFNINKNQISIAQLKEVFKRGYHDSIRLEKPSLYWGLARVNLFLKFCRNPDHVSYAYKKLDNDLLPNPLFLMDDDIRDDIIFSYEQITEAKFDAESFDLSPEGDYSFIDCDYFFDASFPKSLDKKNIKDEKLKEEDPKKFKEEEDKQNKTSIKKKPKKLKEEE